VEKGWDMPQFAVDNVQRAIANGMLLQPSPQRLEYHTATTKDGMEIMDNIFNNMSKFSI